MNIKMNLIEFDADVACAWFAALSDGQIHDPMHTAQSEDDLENYRSVASLVATIAKSEVKDFIVEKAALIYAKRTSAEVELQTDETLFDMLHLGNEATSNKIKTAFAWFSETIVNEIFIHEAADCVMSEFLEQRSKFDTFMNSIVKRLFSHNFSFCRIPDSSSSMWTQLSTDVAYPSNTLQLKRLIEQECRFPRAGRDQT